MKSNYECLFIVDGALKEEERAAMVEKFQKMAGSGAKVEPWGLRKFVTPIDHKKEGYYFLMNFSALPEVPATIGNLMNITEGMIRYMFVNKDDQKTVKIKPKKQKEVKGE